MANRILGRLETQTSSRPACITSRLDTRRAWTPSGSPTDTATVPVALSGRELRLGRDLMRLEFARQAIEAEIAHLRRLQRKIVS